MRSVDVIPFFKPFTPKKINKDMPFNQFAFFNIIVDIKSSFT